MARILGQILCILFSVLVLAQHTLGFVCNSSTRTVCRQQGRIATHYSNVMSQKHSQSKPLSSSAGLSENGKDDKKSSPLRGYKRIPTILTFSRCLVLPVFLLAFYQWPPVWAVSLFIAASLTDFLDGYLARKWNATSDFGSFLDPVADKLMVAAVLLPISGKYGAPVAIPSAVILMREIAVSALREWMATQRVRNVVKVGFLGKLKTATTMVALTLFLMEPIFPQWYKASLISLWVCSVITAWSGALYFIAALPYF